MAKRKVDDMDAMSSSSGANKSQKITNAVDSDDEEFEDESLKYALKDEDIEGQEDGVADAEGEIQFTGFNMKEELEEGHFDKDGMYHWNKDKEIKDNWLDNIDWVKIKQSEEGGEKNENAMEGSDSENEGTVLESKVDVTGCYKKILTYLKPSESITKALKRFGGNRSLSASERLKLKKAGLLEKVLSEQSDNSNQLTDLTELANRILTETGNMDVYQETYEIIEAKVNESSRIHAKEAVLDMYADDFDVKEKERLNDSGSKLEEEENEEKPSSEPIGEVMWEVKRNEKSVSIEGPFTSAQMNNWTQTGLFGDKALVRKCGSNEFYSSSRIDFELYL